MLTFAYGGQEVILTYTANVLTIEIMDFDHVPNPGIMSP